MSDPKLYISQPIMAHGATAQARSRITVRNDEESDTWIQIEAGSGPDEDDMFEIGAPARLTPELRETLIEVLNEANDAANGDTLPVVNTQSNMVVLEVGDETIIVSTYVNRWPRGSGA